MVDHDIGAAFVRSRQHMQPDSIDHRIGNTCRQATQRSGNIFPAVKAQASGQVGCHACRLPRPGPFLDLGKTVIDEGHLDTLDCQGRQYGKEQRQHYAEQDECGHDRPAQ